MKRRAILTIAIALVTLLIVAPIAMAAYQWTKVGGNPLVPGGVYTKAKFIDLELHNKKVRKANQMVATANKQPSWVLPAAYKNIAAGKVYEDYVKPGTKVGAMSFGKDGVLIKKKTTYAAAGKLWYYYANASKTTTTITETVKDVKTVTYRVAMAKKCGNVFIFHKSVKHVLYYPLFAEKRQDKVTGPLLAEWTIKGTVGGKNYSVLTKSTGPVLIGWFKAGTTIDLSEVLQDGWEVVQPVGGNFNLKMPAKPLTLTFVNKRQYVELSALKFKDLNYNGVRDDGEPVWAGVSFTLTGTDVYGNAVGPLACVTGADGFARWTGLAKGDYHIVETVPKGTFPTTSIDWSVAANWGEKLSHDFGNAELGWIKLHKFIDHDLNQELTEGEQPQADVPFTLTGTDVLGNAVGPLTAKSDANGEVVWPDLVPGDYHVDEAVPTGYFATTASSQNVTVNAGVGSELWFGNARKVKLQGAKFLDCDKNGVWDPNNKPIESWMIEFSGTDYLGNTVGPIVKLTGPDGYAYLDDQLPGNYTVRELFPQDPNWKPSTAILFTGEVAEGDTFEAIFGNYYESEVGFGTKGYWSNKNGTARITEADIAFLNTLAPFLPGAVDYWDMPFDGTWTWSGNTYFGTGAVGELSDFITWNQSADVHRLQLAQQLTAFVLNVRHNLPSADVSLTLPDGTMMTAGELVSTACTAWSSGTIEEQDHWQTILEGFNSSDHVTYSGGLGPIVY